MGKKLVCELTGEAITKRGSAMVLDHRVKKTIAEDAKLLLHDGLHTVIAGFVLGGSSRQERLVKLATACAFIDIVRDGYGFEPSVFIVDLVRACESEGKPINKALITRMLKYADGESIDETSMAEFKSYLEVAKSAQLDILDEVKSNSIELGSGESPVDIWRTA